MFINRAMFINNKQCNYRTMCTKRTNVFCSVGDLHHVDADPDPHREITDPDPALAEGLL